MNIWQGIWRQKVKVRQIIIEDFINYKKPSLFIAFPYCSFKCGREVCQNNELIKSPLLEVKASQIVDWFNENPITEAYVFGGLEPFDSWQDLLELITKIRIGDKYSDIVIYSGYTKTELEERGVLDELYRFGVIIKCGRYIPNKPSRYDDLLGVDLASDNQYAFYLGEQKAEFIIKRNPNAEEVQYIQKKIHENDGYCPCKLIKNVDTKCMCKDFRMKDEEGYCDCGLYYKEKI